MSLDGAYEELYNLPYDMLRGIALAHNLMASHYLQKMLDEDATGSVTYREAATMHERMSDFFFNMVVTKHVELSEALREEEGEDETDS